MAGGATWTASDEDRAHKDLVISALTRLESEVIGLKGHLLEVIEGHVMEQVRNHRQLLEQDAFREDSCMSEFSPLPWRLNLALHRNFI